MAGELDIRVPEAGQWLGDPDPLTEQLPSPASLEAIGRSAALLRRRPVTDLSTLREFLGEYQSNVMIPVELPAVLAAWGHARENRLRELVALDGRIATEAGLQPFALASQAVGRAQLRRLLPLRDQRLVRRYHAAILRGEAAGWHTLVYGMVVALYALPLRQALVGYGRQTLRGFVDAASPGLGLPVAQCRELVDAATESLADPVSQLVDAAHGPGLRVV